MVDRRTYLAGAGTALLGALAGCLGHSYDGEAANEFGYGTTETADVAVPLVPIADAREWHADDEAVFVDARGAEAYETAHIAGAIHSEAPEGPDGEDPVEQYDTDRRMVTYCGCPHHLSTLRAAAMIGDGYVHTYAIDEGFGPWRENGYPMDGENVATIPERYRIDGRTDPAHAGAFAWAWHDPSGQREAAPIGDDGRFSLVLQFYDLPADAEIRLSTPAGERRDDLRTLADGTVIV
jgi:rhodanese-related sulfurtransferase